MSYRVEQKIKGRIYIYEVQNFWDKEKKQPRQKRKYIGPKHRIYKKKEATNKSESALKKKSSNFVSKSCGDVFLAHHLQDKLGLTELLKAEFGDKYKEILALSNFVMQESSASYLFPYWHEEHHFESVKKLNSQSLSELYGYLGRHERERLAFLKSWGQQVAPTSGIYYDITSVSSYSKNIESVEWGYNRDKEYLPQINIGFTHCSQTALPVSYTVHPGSIVDVTTLKNTLKTFELFGLKKLFFILDRGFCSVANILAMHKNKMSFIQPLSFSLKKAKALVSKHKETICRPENAFQYKKEIVYHTADLLELENVMFNAHLFYNEKVAIDYKHYLYKGILAIESGLKAFNNEDECQQFLENNIAGHYKPYFQVKGQSIVRKQQAIEEAIFRAGTMIVIVHGQHMTPIEIITRYRNRDYVEKDINALKNHIDTKRLRAHNHDTMSGRLFIKFLALILHAKIINVIKKNEKLKKYSVNEVMAELKKLKINSFDQDNKFLTEISKKQKLIFKAFNINVEDIQQFYNIT